MTNSHKHDLLELPAVQMPGGAPAIVPMQRRPMQPGTPQLNPPPFADVALVKRRARRTARIYTSITVILFVIGVTLSLVAWRSSRGDSSAAVLSATAQESATPQAVGRSADRLQVSARDTERVNDIKALEYKIVQPYYEKNNKYPTLAELNNPDWRATYAKDVDGVLFKDPDGTGVLFAGAAADGIYGYDPTAPDGGACDNVTVECTQYSLSAALEGGGLYTAHNAL